MRLEFGGLLPYTRLVRFGIHNAQHVQRIVETRRSERLDFLIWHTGSCRFVLDNGRRAAAARDASSSGNGTWTCRLGRSLLDCLWCGFGFGGQCSFFQGLDGPRKGVSQLGGGEEQPQLRQGRTKSLAASALRAASAAFLASLSSFALLDFAPASHSSATFFSCFAQGVQ